MTAVFQDAHFFRHEFGRVVALLSRRCGVHLLENIEDAVQDALMKAAETWPVHGTPNNPSAWIYTVSYRNLMSVLRRSAADRSSTDDVPAPESEDGTSDASRALIRMLFSCCHVSIPIESRTVFALKTLCGFSVPEIAQRLFLSEENVYKRWNRARQQLQQLGELRDTVHTTLPDPRLDAVLHVLYLLFTEGYLSLHPDHAIRAELCDEAIRLTALLADDPAGRSPETCALMALQYFHRARMDARQDHDGRLMLLEEQDRSSWDRQYIETGFTWLARSAEGTEFTRYHAEAGIAAEHCRAASFNETRWDRIAECYALLDALHPSAVHRLNAAVAIAEWKGPGPALQHLASIEPPPWLESSFLWSAVHGDLHRRHGDTAEAERYRERALRSVPTAAVRELLMRRWGER